MAREIVEDERNEKEQHDETADNFGRQRQKVGVDLRRNAVHQTKRQINQKANQHNGQSKFERERKHDVEDFYGERLQPVV